MCLAIPARVVALTGPDSARIDLSGVQKEISIALVDDVAVGDYVIVHVGYALTKLDPEEAQRTLETFAAAGLLPEAAAGDGATAITMPGRNTEAFAATTLASVGAGAHATPAPHASSAASRTPGPDAAA